MRKNLLTRITTAVLLLMALVTQAQDRSVSGQVTAASDGSFLPGVNVLLKGTSTGTVTDAQGKYSLSVPSSGGVLTFSFIGLKTKDEVIGDRTIVDVVLEEDAATLSEVVVTALGIEKTRNELAYAAQKVDGSAVSQTRDNNFVNGLSGKVAGLSIKRNNSLGGSTNVVIRGNKSIFGNNQALFVVDGVPIDNSNTNSSGQQQGGAGFDYGNAAADINPDDIESINVLKGAAASALYGSRASNGVIYITTKRGRATKGIGLTVNAGVTFGRIDKSTFAKYQNKYGQGYGAFYEGGPNGDFYLVRDVNGDGIDDLVSPTSEDASWGAPFDPTKLVYQWDSFDPTSPNYHKAQPWVKSPNDPTTFFVNPYATNYNVLLDGGGEKGSFKLGYTKNDEHGMLPNSRINKDFLNFSSSFKVTEKLTATASINASNIRGLGRYGTGYDDKNLMTNFRQWWPVNIDLKAQKAAYFRDRRNGGTGNVTWNWTDPDDLSPIYWDNPYFTRYENYESDNRLRYFGYAMLNYKVSSWLDVMGRVSLDSYNEFQEERQAVGSVSPSYYSRFNRTFREYNYDLMANFNKDISHDISFKGTIGTNIRRTHVESVYNITNGGLVVPRWYALANSKNPISPAAETYTDLGVDGVYASASFGYKKMLFVQLDGRRDVSSSLPKANNAYYYPAASLSFVFSELLGDVSWLTGAKFRANYAEVGNTAPAQSLADYYNKPTPYFGDNGSVHLFSVTGTKNNPNLKPERTKNYEVGLEMNFLDGRAGFDLSYFNNKTVSQIIPIPVSVATGYNNRYVNAGTLENKGFELTLYGTPVKVGEFSWTVNVNWTKYKSRVYDLPEGVDNLQLGSFQGGVSLNAANNQAYGTLRGTNFVYNDKGQRLVDEDGYYQISATSNEVIGNIVPDWTAGINNTLKYKNLSMSFLIDIKKGGDVFSLDMYYGLATGILPETAGLNAKGNPIRDPLADGGGWLFPGVKADGTKNDIYVDASAADGYGTFGYVKNPAAAFVYDASYVKLRELAISYSIPKAIVSKLGPLNGIDVSVVGRNLWIIHKNVPYADPEEGAGSGNLSQGYQVGAYPNVRNLGFNVKLKF